MATICSHDDRTCPWDNGLISMLNADKERAEAALKQAALDAESEAIGRVINSVGRLKLAQALDGAACDETMHRLASILSLMGVAAFACRGEKLILRLGDLGRYQLEERFQEGKAVQVLEPGFNLRGSVLVKASVRY